jgi:hypothetical protein
MADRPTTIDRDAFRQKMAAIINPDPAVSEGDDPWWAIAASQPRAPEPEEESSSPGSSDSRREPSRGNSKAVVRRAKAESIAADSGDGFVPRAPATLEDAGISESQLEALVLKFLLNRTTASGREICEQLRLPFRLLRELMRRMKDDRLVIYKGEAAMSDYVHELTDAGHDRARRYSEQCTYFGSAPVSLADYVASVEAQSIRRFQPRMDQLRRAFGDLVLSDELFSQLGQAISSGQGLFLYGLPGNGKTSIARRISGALGDGIWIPRAISVLGEIIRLYDPSNHEPVPDADTPPLQHDVELDRRWIRIRRPTIVVGGELRMESLEITTNRATGLSEAPLQLKSNGGTLVIDDFGRQRITPAELLNRWIVPLENRHDFLNLQSGRKIQVPFDQLIIFSTNLNPAELVDEAFLRRIPYKIDVSDPGEDQFRALFRETARRMAIEHDEAMLDYLLDQHYRRVQRPMRFCHPRDLLHQVSIYCQFHQQPAAMSRSAVDAAVKNYFAMM